MQIKEINVPKNELQRCFSSSLPLPGSRSLFVISPQWAVSGFSSSEQWDGQFGSFSVSSKKDDFLWFDFMKKKKFRFVPSRGWMNLKATS